MRLHYQLAAAAALMLLAALGWYAFSTPAVDADGTGAARQVPPAPVDTHVAAAGEVIDAIEVVGTALAREAVNIVPRSSGRVTAIHFTEGQQVRAGTPLLELESEQERAELRQAQAELEDAQAQYARARSLGSSRNIAAAEVDTRRAAVAVAQARVDIARARLAEQQVLAPFDGIVGIREISLGAMVDPSTRLTTLDDLSAIRLDFQVPERFLARLQPGQRVRARSSAFSEYFEGEIARIDSRIDPITRSVRVQAMIPNPDRRLRPGMFLNVQVALERRTNAILVPEEALVVEGERRYVYVIAEGLARRALVHTGIRRAGQVELRSGVEAGDEVVTAGVQRLRDGSPVRVRHRHEAEAG